MVLARSQKKDHAYAVPVLFTALHHGLQESLPQLSPAEGAGVVARLQPTGDASLMELVAAGRHDAAQLAVHKRAQADGAVVVFRSGAATGRSIGSSSSSVDVLSTVRDVAQLQQHNGDGRLRIHLPRWLTAVRGWAVAVQIPVTVQAGEHEPYDHAHTNEDEQ